MVLALLSSWEGRAAFTKSQRFGVRCMMAEGLAHSLQQGPGASTALIWVSPFPWIPTNSFCCVSSWANACRQKGYISRPGRPLHCLPLLPWKVRWAGRGKDVRVSPNPTPYPEKAALDNVPTAKGHRERGGAEQLHTTALCSLSCGHWQRSAEFTYLPLGLWEQAWQKRRECARWKHPTPIFRCYFSYLG